MASNAEVLAPEVTGLPAVVRPAADSAIVNPLVTVEEAKAAWEHYQRLTSAILDDSDYQTIGSKKFKKKAAWRKYMRFYGLDEDESRTRIEVSRNGQQFNVPGLPVAFPVFASAFVVVRSGNGKTWTGYHECHVSEKCCPAAVSQPCDKKGWSKHKCCAQGCSGMVHFSHPGDLPATAHTRAKNRAISDAIGAGEVSAEEAEGGRGNASGEDEREPQHICPGCGKTGAVMQSKAEYGGGWLCWKSKGGCGEKWHDPTPADKELKAETIDTLKEQGKITTADKLVPDDSLYQSSLKSLAAYKKVSEVVTFAEWVKEQRIAKAFTADQYADLNAKIAERAVELPSNPKGFEAAEVLLRGMHGELRITEGDYLKLCGRFEDAKESKLAATV